jgi:uncharacterized protein YbjQ (UPF0145 family)
MKNLPVLLSLVLLAGCITGSHVVTGVVHQPTMAGSVKIYSEMPAGAEIIGTVSAMSNASLTWQGAKDQAVKELKKQAAKIGANGILLTDSKDDWQSGAEVTGKAIFVGP